MSRCASLDQENVPLSNVPKAVVADSFRKPARFSQFLQEAAKEVRNEWDEQFAADRQVEEAVILVEEWMMESKDAELAKQLSEALGREAQVDRQMELVKGEAAAIQAAVEERRRVKAEAQAKREQELADAEIARRLFEEEEKGSKQSKDIFEADAKLAEELATFVTPVKEAKAEEKVRTPESPIEHKDSNVVLRRDDLQKDFEAACVLQRDWIREESEQRLRQARMDEELSRRIEASEVRTAFQAKKLREVQACFDKCQRSEQAVANLWRMAEAEVEDLRGSVALTLLLPNIQKLVVTLLKNGKTLRIQAVRLVMDKRVEVTPINSSFIAEFQLEGGDLRISPKDVHHTYSSESGLLHVYIDDVNLDDERHADCKEQPRGSFFRAMKQGFERVFGRGKN